MAAIDTLLGQIQQQAKDELLANPAGLLAQISVRDMLDEIGRRYSAAATAATEQGSLFNRATVTVLNASEADIPAHTAVRVDPAPEVEPPPPAPPSPVKPSTLGDALIAARETLELGRDALAHKIGIAESTLYRWEVNALQPRKRMWDRITQATEGLVSTRDIVDLIRVASATEEEKAALGTLLRSARLARGLMQDRAGMKVGLSQTALSRMELGKLLPDKDVLEKLLTLYGIEDKVHARNVWANIRESYGTWVYREAA